jgi:hypothetical protein
MTYVVVTSLSILGCNSMFSASTTSEPRLTSTNHSGAGQYDQNEDFKWLNYADPKAEANFAIAKGNFSLLIFAGETSSPPGVESISKSNQTNCGYQYLPSNNASPKTEKQLKLVNQLYQYAAIYNELIMKACNIRASKS